VLRKDTNVSEDVTASVFRVINPEDPDMNPQISQYVLFGTEFGGLVNT